MKKNKIINLALVLGTVGLIGAAIPKHTYAETLSANPKSFLQYLIEKFNLNKTDVENAAKDFRNERQEERLKTVEEKLTQAVTDGKITEEQKTKILEKIKSWQDEKDTWFGLTREERMTKRSEHRAEMKKWAEENGIDLHSIIGFGDGMHEGRGMRDGNGRGGMGRGSQRMGFGIEND